MSESIHHHFKINGKEYGSLEEVPAEYRPLIEKALQGGAGKTRYTINGKEYDSVDQIPPELRAKIFEAGCPSNLSGPISIAPKPAWPRIAAFLLAILAALLLAWLKH